MQLECLVELEEPDGLLILDPEVPLACAGLQSSLQTLPGVH
jgi:hypothetical protein